MVSSIIIFYLGVVKKKKLTGKILKLALYFGSIINDRKKESSHG